jgi:hypothetical protein
LAFSLNIASDLFSMRYDNVIGKATDGLWAKVDTLSRSSTTSKEVENTRNFFDSCHTNGFTLNMRKIQWDKKEVLFGVFLLDLTASGEYCKWAQDFFITLKLDMQWSNGITSPLHGYATNAACLLTVSLLINSKSGPIMHLWSQCLTDGLSLTSQTDVSSV